MRAPFKSVVVLLCGPSPEGRREYLKFMDALVFFAEYENPGKNKIWSDSADNMILNGIKYVHGEHEHDFGYDPISMFIKTGTFDENPRAKQLHDAAALRLRIQLKGAMKTMPIPKIDQKKAQEV